MRIARKLFFVLPADHLLAEQYQPNIPRTRTRSTCGTPLH